MKLNLEQLGQLHPRLPEVMAAAHVHHAALALQRRHVSGVRLALDGANHAHRTTLHWTERPANDARQLDESRVTEDGAEAVALCVAHATKGWVVLRRLQRGEHADWLLLETSTGKRVALEVSGTDDGDRRARLVEKLAQVAQTRAAPLKAACVVRFLEPRATLAVIKDAPA